MGSYNAGALVRFILSQEYDYPLPSHQIPFNQ